MNTRCVNEAANPTESDQILATQERTNKASILEESMEPLV